MPAIKLVHEVDCSVLLSVGKLHFLQICLANAANRLFDSLLCYVDIFKIIEMFKDCFTRIESFGATRDFSQFSEPFVDIVW